MRKLWSSETLIILAQLLTLVAFLLGLQFLLRTTGATAFLFSVVAPGLTALALLLVLGVAAHKYRRRHTLFRFVEHPPGQIIFQRGDCGDCAYFIQEGSVEVLYTNPEGQSVQVAILAKGQYFGEMDLILWERRLTTVRALEPTRLAVLGRDNFFALCKVLRPIRTQIVKSLGARPHPHWTWHRA